MWGEWGMGWGWGVLGMVHMALWWALIIIGIVVMLRWLMGGMNGSRSSTVPRALDVLEERYAKGEIAKDEFEQKRSDIVRARS